jgi:aryl-alcohol dehydrogenase-like predicted oxidoreductase
MRSCEIGDSGLTASVICLGGADLGSTITPDEAFAVLDAFAEAGGNFLDTARVYAAWLPGKAGASERTIGAWLRSRGMRERMILGTKGAHPDLDSMHVDRMSPEDISSDLAESLDALQTDRVDIFWLHRDAEDVPVGEIVEAVNVHVREGRVRALGASNWRPARIEAANAYAHAHALTGFCASQIAFSLAVQRDDPAQRTLAMDAPTIRWHAATGFPQIPYTSQARGFFGGKYGRHRGDPASLTARLFYNAENFDRLERAETLAAQRGWSANDVALAYLLSQPFPVFPIVGCRTVDQVRSSTAVASLALSPEELAFLETGLLAMS